MNNPPINYILHPFLNYKNKFFNNGFKSAKLSVTSSKSLDINIFCTVPSTLNIYGYDLNGETDTGNAGKYLLYTKELIPNISLYKSFVPKSSYLTVEVINDQQQEGLLLLQGYFNNLRTFSAQSHLEGKIYENDNCVLIREALDFKTDLIAGNVDYAKQVNISGVSQTNNSGNAYILGYNGVGSPLYSSNALEFYIDCPNINDRPGGIGAETVEITYIDNNYLQQTATINCASFVGTAISGFTINKIKVLSSGSSLSNLGQIKILDSNQNILYALIEPNENISNNFNYQVPIKKSLIVKGLNVHGVSSGSVLLLQKYNIVNNQLSTLGKFKINTTNTNSNIPINFMIEEKNKILIQVTPSAINMTGEFIQCKLDGELLNNKGDFGNF